MKINLVDVVGKGYKTFWNYKGRYRVCKGSRASKKSKTTALNFIVRLMQYPESNLLVVRKVYSTLANSCFNELKWAIHRLCVEQYWDVKQSPLEMTYLPTGQKIYFRGLDDPFKITSIAVTVGTLCWCWIEEAYEITKEEDFNTLDESIRGQTDNCFKQITLTFNPWNERHWLKRRFFDVGENENILAISTNYMCNEWLDKQDLQLFEDMKKNNYRRYLVAGLAEWGISSGLIYEQWEVKDFDLEEIKGASVKSAFGLDFGYTNDPTALFCGLVDEKKKLIYVFDELYEKGLSNERIYEKILKKGYIKEKIIADCAEPKTIDRLRELGMRNIKGSRKGKDSINNGIDTIQDYKIIIHPKCTNFVNEISNYIWDEDKFGNKLNKPIDEFNHLMDAMRYALQDLMKGYVFSFD